MRWMNLEQRIRLTKPLIVKISKNTVAAHESEENSNHVVVLVGVSRPLDYKQYKNK